MPPMQPLGALIAPILQQASLTDKVNPNECQLLLKDKPLDPTLAVRFANLPSSAKITLNTGHEPVLGFHDAAPVAPPPPQPAPSPSKPSAQPPPLQQPSQPLDEKKEQVATPDNSHNVFAGKAIHVFTRQAEAEEDAARVDPSANEFNEEDYEVTEADVRAQLAGYAHRAAQQQKNLMTKAMREAEIARKAAAYGDVPVRIEFPEGLVVQASFPANAPLAELKDLVNTLVVADAVSSCYLFTTPPKAELKDFSVSFYVANLIPAARIHVGFKNQVGESCLKEAVKALCDKPPSRAQALKLEEKRAANEGQKTTLAAPKQEKPGAGGEASGNQSENKRAKSGGVPSWMKLSSR